MSLSLDRLPFETLALALLLGGGVLLFIRSAVQAVRHDRARAATAGPSVRAAARDMAGGAESDTEDAPYHAPLASGLLDLEAEGRGALRLLDSLAARHGVRLEIAVQPELTVRADPRGLRQVLNGLLRNAIGHAPGGKVLLGGMRHGGRVQISVLDDGNGPDRQVQESALRAVERIIALQGGTLEVHSRPGNGTMVLLRLPEPAAARQTTRQEVAATVPPQGDPVREPSQPAGALQEPAIH